jgi:hypothetical protein
VVGDRPQPAEGVRPEPLAGEHGQHAR